MLKIFQVLLKHTTVRSTSDMSETAFLPRAYEIIDKLDVAGVARLLLLQSIHHDFSSTLCCYGSIWLFLCH